MGTVKSIDVILEYWKRIAVPTAVQRLVDSHEESEEEADLVDVVDSVRDLCTVAGQDFASFDTMVQEILRKIKREELEYFGSSSLISMLSEISHISHRIWDGTVYTLKDDRFPHLEDVQILIEVQRNKLIASITAI